ncbi:hypothetical protein ANCDUO_13765 [Ancylostoma duodenale]|uniref:Uncharacterized protein n=1 Tax=Ancylostoma duodenale TaxID=51022 RepID=A0A0C2G501_9BILA|nr:hypothetical protein ANCDUO_13765 [Ancylostoma duodenale]
MYSIMICSFAQLLNDLANSNRLCTKCHALDYHRWRRRPAHPQHFNTAVGSMCDRRSAGNGFF